MLFADRNAMIEQENSQDFVLDLVDEILDCTVQVIHDKYIQSQLQPYSVHAARDLLLQIIEVRYIEFIKFAILQRTACNLSTIVTRFFIFVPSQDSWNMILEKFLLLMTSPGRRMKVMMTSNASALLLFLPDTKLSGVNNCWTSMTVISLLTK